MGDRREQLEDQRKKLEEDLVHFRDRLEREKAKIRIIRWLFGVGVGGVVVVLIYFVF